jgi:hypothetical protein
MLNNLNRRTVVIILSTFSISLALLTIECFVGIDGELVYLLSFSTLLALALCSVSRNEGSAVELTNYLVRLWFLYRGLTSRYLMLVDSTKMLSRLTLRRYTKLVLLFAHALSAKNRFLPTNLKYTLLSLL